MANTGGLGGDIGYSGFSVPKPKTSNTVVRGEGGFDARGFKGLAKALKEADPVMRTALLRNLSIIGDKVAKDAQSIVAPFSESIPPTIKKQVRGEAVRVRAGGGEVHVAGLFELGNHGSKKSAAASARGVWRHPVYGNMNNWVNQPMHRYLGPALAKNRGYVNKMALAALNEGVRVIEAVKE